MLNAVSTRAICRRLFDAETRNDLVYYSVTALVTSIAFLACAAVPALLPPVALIATVCWLSQLA
jgi:hypothetical protein